MSFLIKRQFLTIENCVYVIAAAQGLRGVQLDGSLSIVVWRKEGCFGGWAAGLALCMEGRLLSKVSLFCSKTARYLWAWRLLTLKAATAFLWYSSLFWPFLAFFISASSCSGTPTLSGLGCSPKAMCGAASMFTGVPECPNYWWGQFCALSIICLPPHTHFVCSNRF